MGLQGQSVLTGSVFLSVLHPSIHPLLQPGAGVARISTCLKEMAFASRNLVCFARTSEKMKRSSAVPPALQ